MLKEELSKIENFIKSREKEFKIAKKKDFLINYDCLHIEYPFGKS